MCLYKTKSFPNKSCVPLTGCIFVIYYLAFVLDYGHVGIAIGSSLAAIISVLTLEFVLYRDGFIKLNALRTVVVVGKYSDMVTNTIPNYCETVVQSVQLGTAHALLAAKHKLRNSNAPLVGAVNERYFKNKKLN